MTESPPSIVEATAGFLICCMPTMAAVYRHTEPKISAALNTSLQRLWGSTNPHQAVVSRNSDEDIDPQPRHRESRDWWSQDFTRLPEEDAVRLPTRKAADYRVLPPATP